MSGYKGQQGRKPKASTITERLRDADSTRAAEIGRRKLPPAPAHLTRPGQREWRRMGRQLLDAGLLSSLDLTALALYCDAYARWLEARRILDGPIGYCSDCDPRRRPAQAGLIVCNPPRHTAHPYGVTTRTRLGQSMPSAYLKIANDASAQMAKLLGEFGMTPASRSRIPRERSRGERPQQSRQTSPEQDEDPREGFLALYQGGKA